MSTATAPYAQALPLGRTILVCLPMALLTAVMLTGGGRLPRAGAPLIAFLATFALANTLFFLMVRTGRTDHYRAVLFTAVAVSFALTFIPNLLEVRGRMALTEEDMIRGETPFCHMVIPMTIVPAALTTHDHLPGLDPAAASPTRRDDDRAVARGHDGARQGLVRVGLLLRRDRGRPLARCASKPLVRKVGPALA